MGPILKQFKQILITAIFFAITAAAVSQGRQVASQGPAKPKPASAHLRDFYHLTAVADIVFTFPAGFKETRILNNEDFSYDYAMEMPDHEFEIWFQVKSLKKDWEDYMSSNGDPNKQMANPDSSYTAIGNAQARAFAGDRNFMARDISPDVLARFNATAGKSYLVNLPDVPETKRYKYALLLSLQKDHIGTVLAVCFTNEKNPEFFKNINRISHYLKFKP